MRLYVIDKENSSQKLYLNYKAKTRQELRNLINSNTFILNNNRYSINEVNAEVDQKAATALVAGGAVGLLGGLPGILLGSAAGAILAYEAQRVETNATNLFNQSELEG